MERTVTVESDAIFNNELKTRGLLKAVHEKIRVIATTEVASIIRKDESTGEPVVAVEHTVSRLINMFRILRRCSLDILTTKELAAILETCLRVNSIFDLIKSFDGKPSATKDAPITSEQITSQTETVARSAFQILGLIIAKTFCLSDYFNAQVDGAGEHFARIQALSQEAQNAISDIHRVARYEVGNKFADSFHREASRHNKAAWAWTAAMVVSAAAGIGYLTMTLRNLQLKVSSVPAEKLFATETCSLAIAAFIFFIMVFCARTAASHRHNHILNLQRRNALSTANIVADATASDAFKDGVLIEAAKAAYDPQPTGFERPSGH